VRDPLDHALLDHVAKRFEREVRVDRARSVSDQQRHVVHFPRIAGFHHECAPGAQTFTDQVMVHAGGRQKARDRRQLLIDPAVGEKEHGMPGEHGLLCLLAQPVQRLFEAGAPFGGRVQHRQRHRPESRHLGVADLRHALVVDDRVLDDDLPARLRLGHQQVAFGTDRRFHRGHQLLADCVERRVGDLREQLLEVVVEQARALRQHRERRVGAHRSDRLLGAERHRSQDDLDVLLRIAERLLATENRGMVRRRQERRRCDLFDRDEVLHQPLGVLVLARELPLDLFVRDDPALCGIHEEDPSRMQPFLDDDVCRWDIEHADFRREHDQAVAGHVVAGGSQAVAIEHRADHRAVRERQ
jgi:hypothetical protein